MSKGVDAILETLVEVVSESDDLESFVRPLLELLESVTGLESTYLTKIDLDHNKQKILFSKNTRNLTLPEGLVVPWEDTLCKRALDEGRPFTDCVGDCWGDSGAARALGIVTYLSTPVQVAGGELYGTLCGASGSKIQVSQQARRLLTMFAHLIARQIERERLIETLRRENQSYLQDSLSDPLTGIPNRRALLRELARSLEIVKRSEAAVHVAFIDLDGFKQINDQHGHDAGDRFLREIAGSLARGSRKGDFVARLGGDEFVVIGLDFSKDIDAGREVFRQRVQELTTGQFSIGTTTLDYPGASVGAVTANARDENSDDLLARADAAMYAVKQARKGK